MRTKLAEVFELGRRFWDHPGMNPHVRAELDKICRCGTEEIEGIEWTDGVESMPAFKMCKSRMCSRCGKKATQEWLRQTWRELPNVRYLHVVCTMPDAFWEAVGSCEILERSLCRMAAACLEQWYWEKDATVPYIAAITHTYGEDLKYNPHVHLIVSAGGYRETDQQWVPQAALLKQAEKFKLMCAWRGAVLRRIRLVSEKGMIQGDCRDQSYIDFIDRERPNWQLSVSLAKNKKGAMEYAMRYAKHPPVSNRRIVSFSNIDVSLLCPRYGDPEIPKQIPLEEFVALFSRHVRSHYVHSMRYFGLLAPRNKSRLKVAVFQALGETIKTKPRPRSFQQLAQKTFGKDPVIGRSGASMKLSRKRNGAR